MQMNLLGTHDTERIITILAGKPQENKQNFELAHLKMTEEEKVRGVALLKMAYTILATVPGLPTVFYGDEAGLEGYKDPFNRRPFPWNNINTDILEHYKKIGYIRKNNPVYKDGEFALHWLDKDSLVFERYSENEHLFTVVNNSEKTLRIKFSADIIDTESGDKGRDLILKPLCAKIFKSAFSGKVKFELFKNQNIK
jgi:glycosidase